MYEIFVNSFNRILAEAGYTKINMPAGLPRPAKVDLWGREHEAMVYYYITYDTQAMDWANFPALKDFMAGCLRTISERIGARHAVAFNIFVGPAIEHNANAYINSTGEFALIEQYDLFMGVSCIGDAGGVVYSPLSPVHMDNALNKIKTALNQMSSGNVGATVPVARFPTPSTSQKPPTPQSPPIQISPRLAAPVAKFPIFAVTIMVINAIMFILLELTGGSTNTANLLNFGAAHFALTFEHGQFHRLVTPIFLHIGLMHLVMNTAWLVLAGLRAERFFGHLKFVIIYLASGIIGGIAMMLISPNAVGAGASGAIFGILGALLAYTIITKKAVETFTTLTLGILIGINIFAGFAMPGMLGAETNIAHAAHIGGLISGFILGLLFAKKGSR
jgi:membrane associated rhomboid family serine protease